jgi:RTX calcium-binding nonapeptide repeat (4 copies)
LGRVVIHRAYLIAFVVTLLIGCCSVLLVVGCSSGVRSEAPKEEQQQGHAEATKGQQGRSHELTASEKPRCEGTRTFEKPQQVDAAMTTNDIPGCPKGGLLSGTDGYDVLAGEEGEDEVRGLGAGDFIFGGTGNDAIYGGPGRDNPLVGDEGDDDIHGGNGDDANLVGDEGDDVIYGGSGDDIELHGGEGKDKLYCGEGRDSYMADEADFVSSSCEVRLRPSKSKGIP